MRLKSFFLPLCLLVPLTGCKARPASNGLTHIIFQADWYPQPEMGGFYQAQQMGLYRAAGLDVTIVPGGPTIIGEQQVATGAAQFSMGSSDSVLVRVSNGIPIVAVAATMQQDPQSLMVHADSPVKTFADLEGRTVAVKPGSIWFQYLLKRFGLKNVREIPATYSVANFLQFPDYIQQAFVTSEPYFATRAGAPVRTLLISSTGYQPYRVIFTSRQYLDDHPDIVQKFVDASIAGWTAYLDDPAPVNAELSRLNPALNPDQMRFSVATLKANHFIDGDGTPDSHLGHFNAQRWTNTYQQLQDLHVITNLIDPTTAYTTRFTP